MIPNEKKVAAYFQIPRVIPEENLTPTEGANFTVEAARGMSEIEFRQFVGNTIANSNYEEGTESMLQKAACDIYLTELPDPLGLDLSVNGYTDEQVKDHEEFCTWMHGIWNRDEYYNPDAKKYLDSFISKAAAIPEKSRQGDLQVCLVQAEQALEVINDIQKRKQMRKQLGN